MKVTQFGPGSQPLALSGWSSGAISVNSNFNTVDGGFSATNFVQGITVNGSNMLLRPIANIAAGSNIILTVDAGPGGSMPSNTVRIHGQAGGGGGATISAGSNSTRVSEDSSAGASTTLWSPFDHRHDGIGTITSSSSNTMQRGTWNLRAGSGIALALTDSDGDGEFDTTTIVNTGSGGGGGGGSGAPTTATYVTTTADGTLSAEVVRPQLANYFAETKPTSANATYDDEFDDSSGMSGSVNGLNARWNWRNQSTSTTTFGTAGWLKLSIPAAASASYRIIEIAALADGTYDALIGIDSQGDTTGDAGGGIMLVDGTNGDLYVFVLVDSTGAGTSGLYVQRWTNVTTFLSTAAVIGSTFRTRIFLRVTKSGTTLAFWWSDDGIAFRRLVTLTDAVNATRIGLGCYETKNTGTTSMFVDYFRKTA